MKKTLITTVAAAALIAAAGLASAAEGNKEPAGAGMSQGAQHGAQPNAAQPKGAQPKAAQTRGKAETTGSGQAESQQGAEPKSGTHEIQHNGTKSSMDSKSGMDKSKSSNSTEKSKSSNTAEKSKPSTTGAGSGDQMAPKSTAGEKSGTSTQSGMDHTTTQSGMDQKSGAAASKSTTSTTASTSAGGSVSLTSEQKTKIRTTVLTSGSAPKVSRSSVNFNIAVGTVVPRSVHFAAVPDTIIEIHPAWRGYRYFVVDEEIIIVEPSSFKIVAVLTV